MRLRFSHRRSDMWESLMLCPLTAVCVGIVATYPEGGWGEDFIPHIFTGLGIISSLLGIDILFGTPMLNLYGDWSWERRQRRKQP